MPHRFLLLVLIAVAGHVQAVEGLWEPAQLVAVEEPLRAAGIAVDPRQLADLQRYPMNAVVDLGGNCSASLVSPLGLILTSHQCADASIRQSRDGRQLEDGFVARTLGEELRSDPELRVYITQSVQDVSAQLRVREGQSRRDRADAIDRRSKRLLAACERDPAFRCQMQVFDDGARHVLVKRLQIRDVRLVYAPATAISRFGGDADRPAWPSHSGNFALLRAYVGPDGKPADFSELNVPLRPPSHLKLQPAGLSSGDFAMAIGFPRHTRRYRLAEEAGDAQTRTIPASIKSFQAVLALIAEHTRDRPDAALRYADQAATLRNQLEQAQGSLDILTRSNLAVRKTAEEAAILVWARKHQHADGVAAHATLKTLVPQHRSRHERALLLKLLDGTSFATTRDLVRLAIERGKPDIERAAGYQRRDEARIEARLLQFDRHFDAGVDRVLLKYLLQRLIDLPADQRLPELDRWVAAGDGAPTVVQLDARLDALYSGTQLADAEQRMRWLKADRTSIESDGDPALALAVALLPGLLRIDEDERALDSEREHYRRAWMTTLTAHAKANGRVLYADANGSLRVSFGTVGGYRSGTDAVLPAFADVAGLTARHTGVAPFDAGKRQLEAISAGRFDRYAVDAVLPVNLLADLDTTDGSPGSPLLNARAELVGVAFAGNPATLAAEWLFDPAQSRTIAVDIRYILWVMDAIDGAHGLLEEMGVKPAFADAPG